MFLNLQQVTKGGGFDNLTTMLVNFITIIGGFSKEDLATKLVSFDVNGVTVFHGLKIGVTMQFIEQHAPFVIGIHYMAHRCNLVMQSFSSLPPITKIKGLLQGMCVYFSHYLKTQLEHAKLVKVLKTKGSKIFRNVKTRWISMLALVRLVLVEYKSLVVKMGDDMVGMHLLRTTTSSCVIVTLSWD
jgi:hypothetical protein